MRVTFYWINPKIRFRDPKIPCDRFSVGIGNMNKLLVIRVSLTH